jgi:hypothetical protein
MLYKYDYVIVIVIFEFKNLKLLTPITYRSFKDSNGKVLLKL